VLFIIIFLIPFRIFWIQYNYRRSRKTANLYHLAKENLFLFVCLFDLVLLLFCYFINKCTSGLNVVSDSFEVISKHFFQNNFFQNNFLRHRGGFSFINQGPFLQRSFEKEIYF